MKSIEKEYLGSNLVFLLGQPHNRQTTEELLNIFWEMKTNKQQKENTLGRIFLSQPKVLIRKKDLLDFKLNFYSYQVFFLLLIF